MKNVEKCESAMEIWDFLGVLRKDSEQITRNKLQVCVEKYESFAMIDSESILQIKTSFNSIISELSALGRTYPVAEMNAKILARMPGGECFVKVTILKERGLSKLPTKDVFAAVRAHEFDLARTNEHKVKKAT